jgi:hypothetical protein
VGLRRALIALALIVALPLSAAADAAAIALQLRVKAAFLYKFAGYVEWPAGAFADRESPIVIAVAGADDVARELEAAIADRTVAGRPLQVRRLAAAEKPGDCCQILFVGARNDASRTNELLANAQGRPVLTVTERESEHPNGAVINFVPSQDRVRFDISREAAEKNSLQLRSQLLGVARQVTGQ